MNPWIAVLALLGALTAGVVATMALENWRRWVEPTPLREEAVDDPPGIVHPTSTPAGPSSALPRAAATPDSTPVRTGSVAPSGADEPAPTTDPPAAGRPEGALVVTGSTIAIRDAATADVLAGLLFAAVAVSGRSGADRAAAWVTATATPPGADRQRFAPGVRLRGRPTRVASLLSHRDHGVTWVGVQHGVDIERGLARTPVTQPTLGALVEWWRRTRTMPSEIDAVTAGRIAEAISTIRGELTATTWVGVVDQLQVALSSAAAVGVDPIVTLTEDASDLSAAISGGPRPAALRS